MHIRVSSVKQKNISRRNNTNNKAHTSVKEYGKCTKGKIPTTLIEII